MGVRDGHLDRNLLPAGVCLIACVAFFVWASGRGYDISDEAYYLAWDSAPFSYHFSLSLFGYLWHPVYRLVGGDIALLRIAGAAVLVACSAVFAFALQEFIGPTTRSERYLIVLSICTSAFWFFAPWMRVPGYNEINLCALLLFTSSLLVAAARDEDVPAGYLLQTIGPAILSGASLGVMALVKPTTCAIAIVLAFTWLALLRPPKPFMLIVISATSAVVTVAIAALQIDGSLPVFLDRQLSNFAISRLADRPGDMHGVVNSIFGPFAADRVWKVFPAIALGAAIAATCLGIVSTALGVLNVGRQPQRIISYGLAAGLGVFIGLARAVDPQTAIAWYNYHAWYLTLLFLAAAIAVVLMRMHLLADDRQRRARAAAFVAVVPLAYSFGTNVALLRHIVGASVFWAGTTVLICALGSPAKRAQLIGISSVAIGIATIGLLAGVARAPLAREAPLFQQTEPVTIGPDGTRLLVDRATAGYLKSLQHAVTGAGFRPGTLVVDLTETGPGIVFALSGSTAGSPWLGDTPDGSLALASAVLKSVPRSQLQHAWIITGSNRNLADVRLTLESLGLPFPAGYRAVIAAKLDSVGWRHTIWKPIAN